jgi:hypothetical protein
MNYLAYTELMQHYREDSLEVFITFCISKDYFTIKDIDTNLDKFHLFSMVIQNHFK